MVALPKQAFFNTLLDPEQHGRVPTNAISTEVNPDISHVFCTADFQVCCVACHCCETNLQGALTNTPLGPKTSTCGF